MALIKCPECGANVSDQAPKCPQCGAPINANAPSSSQSPLKTFFAYNLRVLKQKYATFNGRARRKEFWYFALLYAIVDVILRIISAAIDTYILCWIWELATLIPYLAVGTRRLHDINKSGWWQFIALTVVGLIPLFIWWATEGEGDTNQYGDNPKLEVEPTM